MIFLYLRYDFCIFEILNKFNFMKKIILLLGLMMIPVAYGQKKKTAIKGFKAEVIGKSGTITAELFKKKDAYHLYLQLPAKNKKDTISLKTAAYDPKGISATINNNVPTNCVITPFTAKGTNLYTVSWMEKNRSEIPDKKEDATRTVTEIWNLDTKTQLYSNTQTTTKIIEILWLDKGKNASQTSEKIRNEGFVMTVSPEGDIVLKNRTQEDRLSYDTAESRYVPVKDVAIIPKKKK